VGDLLKQGRYEPKRCYDFPQIDRRRNAKIDVYQHIGSCLVAVDPEMTSEHSVGLTAMDPAFSGIRMKVQVMPKGAKAANNKQQREERAKVLKAQAKEYLSAHAIEERLAEAVKALLQQQPAAPTEFLCRHLRESGSLLGDEAPPPEEERRELCMKEKGQPAPVGPAAPPDALEAIRQEAENMLTQAYESGSLAKALEAQKRPNQEQELRQGEEPKQADPTSSSDASALRKQACEMLVTASNAGDLRKVLEDTRAEAPAKSAKEDDARQKAYELIQRANNDGRLAQGLNSTVVGRASQDLGSLRANACEMLKRTCMDGRLAEELSKKEACAVLLQASADGRLAQTLLTGLPNQKDLGALREKACEVLMRTSMDGNLTKTLSSM
jgi:hypothetical protein